VQERKKVRFLLWGGSPISAQLMVRGGGCFYEMSSIDRELRFLALEGVV
jgi:hypothetical protein